MLKIYFAAPLFTQGERLLNQSIADQISAWGYQVFLPQSIQNLPLETLYQTLMDELNQADCVVAVVDGADADSGTCFEIGYAFAQGKPIISIRTDFRQAGDTGGYNLMIWQSCQAHIHYHENSQAETELRAALTNLTASKHRG